MLSLCAQAYRFNLHQSILSYYLAKYNNNPRVNEMGKGTEWFIACYHQTHPWLIKSITDLNYAPGAVTVLASAIKLTKSGLGHILNALASRISDRACKLLNVCKTSEVPASLWVRLGVMPTTLAWNGRPKKWFPTIPGQKSSHKTYTHYQQIQSQCLQNSDHTLATRL